MIDIRELRIGNWINEQGLELQVGMIQDGLFDSAEPIPLNEEWLIKLGCRRAKNGFWLPMTNLKAEMHFEIHGKEIVTSIESDFACLILDPVKYAHSLQNLFYSLTGKELGLVSSPDKN